MQPLKWVIDADVARSAGETQHPISSNCRNFLECIRTSNHYIVMSHELRKEWDKHASIYARTWLKNMTARKLIIFIYIEDQYKFFHSLDNYQISNTQQKIALKDCHLIDATLITDKYIASGDDNAREVFVLIATQEKKLREIIWINPKTSASEIVSWINSGKKPHSK